MLYFPLCHETVMVKQVIYAKIAINALFQVANLYSLSVGSESRDTGIDRKSYCQWYSYS